MKLGGLVGCGLRSVAGILEPVVEAFIAVPSEWPCIARSGTMKFYVVLVAGATLVGLAPGSEAKAAPASPAGIWTNSKGTMQVLMSPCGSKLCGKVIRASEAAQEKARRRGTQQLVGLQVLSDFEPASRGLWKGKVYVPEVRTSLSSNLTITGANEITVSGCLPGRLLCKTQIWRRLSSTH